MRCMQTMSLFTWDKQVAVKLTTPGWANARDDAPVHLAFRDSDHVGTQTILLSRASRPAEFHRQPLSEPSVKLSPHWAPIRRTSRSYRVSSARRSPGTPQPAV
jgi:hypothetical protein